MSSITAAAFLAQRILHDETEPPTRNSDQDRLRQAGDQVGVSGLDRLIQNKALVPLSLPAVASVSTSTTSTGLGVLMPFAGKVWAFTAGAMTAGATCTADLMRTPAGGSIATMLNEPVDIATTKGTSMAQGTMDETLTSWGEFAAGDLLHMKIINGITTAATGIAGVAWIQRL